MYKNKKTLALVDDHPIVIEGLKSVFAPYADQYTLLSFTDGASVLSYMDSHPVAIILLDIALPGINGLEVCRRVKTAHPETKVIGLSNQAEQSTILQMLQDGASGFLLKDTPAPEILTAIEEAFKDEIVLSSEVKKILATPTSSKQQLPSLTRREKQILQLLVQGMTTKEIAAGLFLSKLTVDTYRKNLLQKFSVKNTTELLMLLVDHKMI